MSACLRKESAIAYAVMLEGNPFKLTFRRTKAHRDAQEVGGNVLPLVPASDVADLMTALDEAASNGFVPGQELDRLIAARTRLNATAGGASNEYWSSLAVAHDTQAAAHRLYASVCRHSGRTDDATQAAIAHNDTQAGYFAKRADEARAMGAAVLWATADDEVTGA